MYHEHLLILLASLILTLIEARHFIIVTLLPVYKDILLNMKPSREFLLLDDVVSKVVVYGVR